MRRNKNDYTIIGGIMQQRYLTYQDVVNETGIKLSTLYSVVNGFTTNPRPETRKILDKFIKNNMK